MHRFIKQFFLFLYIQLCFVNVSIAAEQNIWANTKYEPTQMAMELKKVSEHVYYVQGQAGTPTDFDGFMSNASVIIADDSVVVFDSLGTPSLAYLLLTKIRKITDKPIKHIILSHYHADHIYGIQVFKEQGAEVIAPLGAKDYLDSPAAEGRLKQRRESLFPWVNNNTYLVKPDKYIDESTSMSLKGIELEIKSMGSTHSNGDLSVFVKPDNVLLAGDLMFEGRIPFVAGSKPQVWIDNLNALDPGRITVIIPGHGPASSEPAQAVKFTKHYLQFLQKTMGQAVEELIPFADAYTATDWSEYKKLPAFRVNRMNAYFMYLGLEAESMK